MGGSPPRGGGSGGGWSAAAGVGENWKCGEVEYGNARRRRENFGGFRRWERDFPSQNRCRSDPHQKFRACGAPGGTQGILATGDRLV